MNIKSIVRIVVLALLLINFKLCAQQSNDLYRVVGITIPKCGSNMLLKMLRKMCYAKFNVPRMKFFLIDNDAVKALMRNPIWILMTHAIYVDNNIKKINNEQIKKVFMIRDPRDQIVSAAFWIKTLTENEESAWDFDVLIDELIMNTGFLWSKIFLSDAWLQIHDITAFYNLYLPWIFEPNVYTTTFEKLVGMQGGGNEDEQIKEIIAIGNHLGKLLSWEEAKKIADTLFGGTLTFREGKIGSWKEHFLERHKIAFKGVAGQLLIDLGYEKDFAW